MRDKLYVMRKGPIGESERSIEYAARAFSRPGVPTLLLLSPDPAPPRASVLAQMNSLHNTLVSYVHALYIHSPTSMASGKRYAFYRKDIGAYVGAEKSEVTCGTCS